MAEGERSGWMRRVAPSSGRAGLVLTVAAVVILGAAYYAYYRQQVAYYTGRNLRLLSTLTAQVDDRVDSFAGFVKTNAETAEKTPIDVDDCADVPVTDTTGAVKRKLEDTAAGWNVRLAYRGKTAAKCASLPLDAVVRPIFTRKIAAAFDVLLVAAPDGAVLYSVRPPRPASTLLRRDDDATDDDAAAAANNRTALAERPSGVPLLVSDLHALSLQSAWHRYEELKLGTLLQGARHENVAIDGKDYELFAQPYVFARASASAGGKAEPWIVCGLVSSSRFRYDVSAISTSIILLGIAIAVLAICCWPFLRIALIDACQPLTITDVVLVVFCTITGAAVLTLLLLDCFGYEQVTHASDEQLERFADDVDARFAKNVARAANAVDAIASVAPPAPALSSPIPERITTLPAVKDYPYIDSIAWIGPDGMQQKKVTRMERNARVSVKSRRYFNDAFQERTWDAGGHRYVLEWVRSTATGAVNAVLSRRTSNDALPVLAMATELIDVSEAVRPAGVQIAIINEDGEVLFHSDTQRIGYENFFAEADGNRDLRSTVIARRRGFVTAAYWGDDQRLFVRPLAGSPWTLVTFRAQRLMRVLNVEGALLSLMLLLGQATPYVFVYAIVLLLAPWYRAPSLWPDATRWGDYARLVLILGGLLAIFIGAAYTLSPWSAFFAVVVVPPLAFAVVYLVLHRHRRWSFRIGAVMCAAGAILLIVAIARGDVDPGLLTSAHPRAAKVLLITATLALAACTMASVIPRLTMPLAPLTRWCARVDYATLYRACGVLLLGIGVVVPTAAFFTISRRVATETLVKYSQLRAATDLERRIARLETLNVVTSHSPAVRADILGYTLGDAKVFDTCWSLGPPALGAMRIGCVPPDKNTDGTTIPLTAARWLPTLYEDSVAIRQLYEAASADKLWSWCVHDGRITLDRKIRFENPVATRLWTKPPPTQSIYVGSALPRLSLWRASERRTGEVRSDRWWYRFIALLCLAMLVAALLYATNFIATRVVLIDVAEPIWLAKLPLSPTLGDHIFLVRRGEDVDALTGSAPMGKGIPFIDVHLAFVDRFHIESELLARLESSASGRNIRIVDFEYGIDDGAINAKKLQWLEALLALGDRTIIVVSTVGPAFLMTTPPPPSVADLGGADAYYARWRALLDRFVCVTAEELQLRQDEWERRTKVIALPPATTRLQRWLQHETEFNSFLRRLRDELGDATDRKHLLDEIGERAETYYAGLWATCRPDEKLLLSQLAHHCLANGRNRRMLRMLIARGLVRRDPNLELFSETFRLYVLNAARREDLAGRARAVRPASAWDRLRLPLFIVIMAFLALLFGTQKDLLSSTAALATGLTTGLPMLVKLIGVFTEKRLETAERS